MDIFGKVCGCPVVSRVLTKVLKGLKLIFFIFKALKSLIFGYIFFKGLNFN